MNALATIVGIAGTTLAPDEAALLRAYPPAGVILFGRNVTDRAQLTALTAALRAALPPGAVLMVDQEGGRVARLRPPQWRAHPSAGRMGTLFMTNSEPGLRAAWLTGALIGLDCADAGFDVVCAPVLDLFVPGCSDVVGDRSFGADPTLVSALGGAMAAGLLAAGMQPVMKHMPGHGGATVDSHLAMPEAEDISQDALLPFQINSGLPWAMTAHMLFRARDPVRPATVSPIVIHDVIRGEIGFQGLLASDDLAMQALTGMPAERALAALVAGCDVAMYCAGTMAANIDILMNCPPLTSAAMARLDTGRTMAALQRQPLDAASLSTERDALIA